MAASTKYKPSVTIPDNEVPQRHTHKGDSNVFMIAQNSVALLSETGPLWKPFELRIDARPGAA